MQYQYPTPTELGIEVPSDLMPERFQAGFRHALTGGQICQAPHLRRSFREGYRAAKLYLRWLRRRQGVLEFPMRGRFTTRVNPS